MYQLLLLCCMFHSLFLYGMEKFSEELPENIPTSVIFTHILRRLRHLERFEDKFYYRDFSSQLQALDKLLTLLEGSKFGRDFINKEDFEWIDTSLASIEKSVCSMRSVKLTAEECSTIPPENDKTKVPEMKCVKNKNKIKKKMSTLRTTFAKYNTVIIKDTQNNDVPFVVREDVVDANQLHFVNQNHQNITRFLPRVIWLSSSFGFMVILSYYIHTYLRKHGIELSEVRKKCKRKNRYA